MTAYGQKILIQHLTDRDALETLAMDGLLATVLPTEELRPVYKFAIDYFHQSGRTHAPSVTVLMQQYGDLLNEHEIELADDPEDTIQWAIDDLKGSLIHKEAAAFNKQLATDMAEAEVQDRLAVLSEAANTLVGLSMSLDSHDSRIDARIGLPERLQDYESRVGENGHMAGLCFGLDRIDEYTYGVHDGELAVLAAGPKVGKSYFLDLVALREWQRDRCVVLFSLENSVQMTLDRIACLAMNVDSSSWQHGTCTEEEIERVRMWVDHVQNVPKPLWVLQPELGKRGVEQLVREAQLRGADSLIIDQLSHIEPPDPRQQPRIQVQQIARTLKGMISTGRDKMPCLLAHQISREGVKAAQKTGYLEMYHLAESADVERVADFVFSLFQSSDERIAMQAKFQTLAARRLAPKHFMLTWSIDTGYVNVRNEFEIDQ